MDIAEFQRLIERTYLERDRERGVDGTFRWLVEEVGELAKALRNVAKADTPEHRANLEEELADVLAWLSTIASIVEVDLGRVAHEQYGGGCPKCRAIPCTCPLA